MENKNTEANKIESYNKMAFFEILAERSKVHPGDVALIFEEFEQMFLENVGGENERFKTPIGTFSLRLNKRGRLMDFCATKEIKESLKIRLEEKDKKKKRK